MITTCMAARGYHSTVNVRGYPMTPARRIVVAIVLLVIAVLVWRWPADSRRKAAPTPKPAAGARTSRPAAPIRLSEAQVARDEAATAGAIEGTVVSQSTGAGIGGAELVFEHAGAAHTVTAGGDGAFRFA